jgi:hypothetical protein
MQAIEPMPTVGIIAQRLGRPTHQVEYVIRTRHIEPIGRAGIARVFSDEAVERIGSEIRRIEAAREDPRW